MHWTARLAPIISGLRVLGCVFNAPPVMQTVGRTRSTERNRKWNTARLSCWQLAYLFTMFLEISPQDCQKICLCGLLAIGFICQLFRLLLLGSLLSHSAAQQKSVQATRATSPKIEVILNNIMVLRSALAPDAHVRAPRRENLSCIHAKKCYNDHALIGYQSLRKPEMNRKSKRLKSPHCSWHIETFSGVSLLLPRYANYNAGILF